MSRELKLRIVSALVLAGLVLEVTWFGGYAYAILWAVAVLLVFHEYSRICDPAVPKYITPAAFAALVATILMWVVWDKPTALLLFGAYFFTLGVWEFAARRTVWIATGLAYSVLPFFALIALRGEPEDSLMTIFVLFACVWGADVFAYFAGRSIGGPKLAPKISPKKTWAGFIGSLIGALALSWAVVAYSGYGTGMAFFVLVIILAVISQIGDLVESSYKRKFGVKDSGRIIPGHGGLLDRVDGLIFAGILFWFILVSVAYTTNETATLPQVFVSAFLKQ